MNKYFSLESIELDALANKLNTKAGSYYSTGSFNELTLNYNRKYWEKYYYFVPKILQNVEEIEFQSYDENLNIHFNFPLMFAPVAQSHLANPEGDLLIAKSAKELSIPFVIPMLSTYSLEEVLKETDSKLICCQLYLYKDKAKLQEYVLKLAKLNVKYLFITVDSSALGVREKDIKANTNFQASSPRSNQNQIWSNAFSLADVKWLASLVPKIKLIIKGVSRLDDVISLINLNCISGIVISNHGGRNLDFCRPTLLSLIEINQGLINQKLRHKISIGVDGGIRRGSDIVIAKICGADYCLIGRPLVYALACCTKEENVLLKTVDILKDETTRILKLIGMNNINKLNEESNLIEKNSML